MSYSFFIKQKLRSLKTVFPFSCGRVVTFSFLSAFLLTETCFAETETSNIVSSSELQSAFVYNFMLFSQWPNKKNERVLCVAGQNRDSLALKQLEGKELDGGKISVRRIITDSDVLQCDALFIASLEYMHLPDFVEKDPILVFSNLRPDYADNIAIIISSLGNRVVFDVNLSSLRKSNIHLGASVLRLARSTQ